MVTLIYKKGDPADYGNYRPICLLNSAYKIFAMIVLKRLLRAGADERVWSSQFGFRKGRGTADALHCTRRALERALSDRGGRLHLLALDWQKAFDSINTDVLLNALRRFGLPGYVCEVIQSIYTDRSFKVRECGETSEEHRQGSGICQGCPLSPFLFIMVMTILMADAVQLLPQSCIEARDARTLFDLLYADDTLLLGCDAACVETFAQAVEQAGASYGMTLHWGKTQAMSVGTAAALHKPDGSLFENQRSLHYLGALIGGDGRTDSEVSRKLGLAKADFNRLQRLWGHTAVSQQEKIRFLDALVMSRLQYGLSTVWLVTAQRRRLDGFYARCLRRILRIAPAYISRISNARVFSNAGRRPFSHQLLKHQLLLLRKVAISPAGGPLRQDTFADSSLQPQMGRFVRRVGRPRQDWTTQLMREGRERMGHTKLQTFLQDGSVGSDRRWRAEVDKLFK